MSYCCNPTSQIIEFPIVDTNFPDINIHKCFCQNYEELCKLKQKIICEYWDIIHKLNCGILPDLEFLLQEISLIYAINNEGIGVEISNTMNEIITLDRFYIGAASNYEDILSTEYIRQLDNKSYDVVFKQNDYLFLILPLELDYQFQRADMNGFEIPFNKEQIKINDNDFIIYTSLNRYNEGIYNIDITYGKNTILSK